MYYQDRLQVTANTETQNLITLKLSHYQEDITSKYSCRTIQQLLPFIKPHIIDVTFQSVSRLDQINTGLNVIRTNKPLFQSFFGRLDFVMDLIDQARQLYDLAWIVRQHKNAIQRNEVDELIRDRFERKCYAFLDQTSDGEPTLYVQSFNLFITMTLSSSKSPAASFVNNNFHRLRIQCEEIYQHIFKTLFESKNLKQYFKKLINLLSWLVFIKDRPELIHDLAKKIYVYILFHKNQNSIEMMSVCNKLFDLLSVKFPKQTKISHLNLSALIVKLKQVKLQVFFEIWLEQRHKIINTIDFAFFFKNLAQIGAGHVIVDLLLTLISQLKLRKLNNILLKLFSTYIRNQYLKVWLRNGEDLMKYVRVAKIFMASLCNRQRFQGQQIDALTANICRHLTMKGFSLNFASRQIVEFYSLYENRFSCLSETSKRFYNEIKQLYKISLDTATIHSIFQELIIHEINLQDDEFQQKASNRYRGIQNLGNTCYINSFMQALYMTKKFRIFIYNLTKDGELPSSNLKVYSLSNLFEELSHKEFDMQLPIRPDIFRSQLCEPYRTSFQQQDAAQFARAYFQELKTELNESNMKRAEKLLIQKMVRSIRCLNCKGQKLIYEDVFDIILNVQKNDSDIFVSKSMKQYFTPQSLQGQNQVYCDKCQRNTDSLCELMPKKLSDILVLTLSIFQYVGQGRKILTPLAFEFVLDVGGILNGQWGEYELYAFIVHLGKGMGSGHYITYSRNLEENPMIWYCFDDGYVSEREISRPEQFRFSENETPYILFYSKKVNNLLGSGTKLHKG